jgi:transposase
MKNNELPANRLKAIMCLLGSDSIELVAKKAGVSRGTIYNWLKDERFKGRLEQERQKLFEEGLNALKAATTKAAQTLIKLLDSKDLATRRLASKTIIDFAIKAVEMKELEERVGQLEKFVEQNKGGIQRRQGYY